MKPLGLQSELCRITFELLGFLGRQEQTDTNLHSVRVLEAFASGFDHKLYTNIYYTIVTHSHPFPCAILPAAFLRSRLWACFAVGRVLGSGVGVLQVLGGVVHALFHRRGLSVLGKIGPVASLVLSVASASSVGSSPWRLGCSAWPQRPR